MDTLLYPLEWFVAAIMVGWHKLFSLVGLPEASGWTWALSIAGLPSPSITSPPAFWMKACGSHSLTS